MAPSAFATTINDYVPLPLDSYTVNGCMKEKERDGVAVARELIGDAFKARIEGVDGDTCKVGDEDAFFVADLGEVYRQHLRWKRNLGRVKPHYAVKCNPDPQVLRLLAALGTGFDCASKAEIEQVLKLGVEPSRIIYAQPCKTKSHLRYAASHGVNQMTFDNADELYKAKQLFPDAELFLRILTDDSASLCRLSLKFGAGLDTTGDLLRLAKELHLKVVGVAFHVGSGASDPKAFLRAARDARFVFDQAADLGFHLHTLDVGGGFVPETFEPMAAALSAALDRFFLPSVRVIGEPGRYYVSAAFSIACHVIARRTVVLAAPRAAEAKLEVGAVGAVEKTTAGWERAKSYMLYLNDGVYGNFSSIMFDHQHPVPRVLQAGGRFCYDYRASSASDGAGLRTMTATTAYGAPAPRLLDYSVWGPTCDGIDCISEQWQCGQELHVGDWLYFEDMGAYTKCSATRFNGFTDAHEVVYVCSEVAASSWLEGVTCS